MTDMMKNLLENNYLYSLERQRSDEIKDEFLNEFNYWRYALGEKLINGDLKAEGIENLDEKVKRVYEIGYFVGRYDGEKHKEEF